MAEEKKKRPVDKSFATTSERAPDPQAAGMLAAFRESEPETAPPPKEVTRESAAAEAVAMDTLKKENFRRLLSGDTEDTEDTEDTGDTGDTADVQGWVDMLKREPVHSHYQTLEQRYYHHLNNFRGKELGTLMDLVEGGQEKESDLKDFLRGYIKNYDVVQHHSSLQLVIDMLKKKRAEELGISVERLEEISGEGG